MRDLGSASGSFVNNKRLSQPSQESNPVEVHPDDTIQLGSNYTDDESALNKDRKKPSSPAIPHSLVFSFHLLLSFLVISAASLRCILVRATFTSMRPNYAPPSLPLPAGLISPQAIMSPRLGDLNNLTHIISTSQMGPPKFESSFTPPSPAFSLVIFLISHLSFFLSFRSDTPPPTSPSIGLAKSGSREQLADMGRKTSQDQMNVELMRKKDLEARVADMQLKTSYSFSSVCRPSAVAI